MEKIIFLSLSITILCFLLFLGFSAISKGFEAKNENSRSRIKSEENKLSEELVKLSELHQSEVLTKEEFEKAKKKLIEN
jgi:hypothetical protein|tara:strand:+ start:32 stop:268 length:237 start_codon:yes stop_codon:yes gene_type:complete